VPSLHNLDTVEPDVATTTRTVGQVNSLTLLVGPTPTVAPSSSPQVLMTASPGWSTSQRPRGRHIGDRG
jgi:hypothetical protein